MITLTDSQAALVAKMLTKLWLLPYPEIRFTMLGDAERTAAAELCPDQRLPDSIGYRDDRLCGALVAMIEIKRGAP